MVTNICLLTQVVQKCDHFAQTLYSNGFAHDTVRLATVLFFPAWWNPIHN